ncbi:DUF397 domain-containing protein [Streptomyces sp. NRRL F-5135]|uniref:DUF397 domain-containing protein n=1 Tax=Streptomyces sp. NRRL F-5135 TaxID=1463858 RepID=UPI0004C61B6E|nr:DUF397 domain-containing protein [Streptomyces sp. NRRL F-5135]
MSNTHTLTWRKSSYSDGGDGNCIEIAAGIPALVPVRDSKSPDGPVFLFSPAAWAPFLTAVKRGVLPPG